jgi:hypothetical protein
VAKSSKAKAQTKASKVRAKTFATKQQSPHVLVQAQPHPPSTVPTPHVLTPAHPPPVFLTKREVLAKVRLSFATIWKLMQSGEFRAGVFYAPESYVVERSGWRVKFTNG